MTLETTAMRAWAVALVVGLFVCALAIDNWPVQHGPIKTVWALRHQ